MSQNFYAVRWREGEERKYLIYNNLDDARRLTKSEFVKGRRFRFCPEMPLQIIHITAADLPPVMLTRSLPAFTEPGWELAGEVEWIR